MLGEQEACIGCDKDPGVDWQDIVVGGPHGIEPGLSPGLSLPLVAITMFLERLHMCLLPLAWAFK